MCENITGHRGWGVQFCQNEIKYFNPVEPRQGVWQWTAEKTKLQEC